MRGKLLEAERVHSIVAAFFTVFNYFGGGGMCEAAYTGALEYELTLRGHKVDREVLVPVQYKGRLVARQRVDIASSTLSKPQERWVGRQRRYAARSDSLRFALLAS